MDVSRVARCVLHCVVLICVTLVLSAAKPSTQMDQSRDSTDMHELETVPAAEDSDKRTNMHVAGSSGDKEYPNTQESDYKAENEAAWDKMKFRQWGKRDLHATEEQDKLWPLESDEQLEKRAWGAANRNWGKRVDGEVDEEGGNIDELEKKFDNGSRMWGKRGGETVDEGLEAIDDKRSWSQSARTWGKRADTVPNLNGEEVYVDKKWEKNSRLWGKRSDDDGENEADFLDAYNMNKKWAEQSRLWGKRNDASYSNDAYMQELGDLDKKWDTGSRVWGKRVDPNTYEGWNTGNTRLWGKRADDSDNDYEHELDEEKRWANVPQRTWGKRQWSGKMRRVWGKRSDEEIDYPQQSAELPDKRAWFSDNTRLWGKRAWGAANRNWGKRADGLDAFDGSDVTSAPLENVVGVSRVRRSIMFPDEEPDKRLWYSDYKRRWGKRSTDDILADATLRTIAAARGNEADEKRGWSDKSRSWGRKRSPPESSIGWRPDSEVPSSIWNVPASRTWGKRFEPKDYYVIPNLDRRSWDNKYARLWG